MKTLLAIIISLVFVVSCETAKVDDTPISIDDGYKCLAELYPKTVIENGVQKLGDTFTSEAGEKFKVLAECKKINEDVWVQFLDTDMNSHKLDNKPDYAIQLFMKDGQLWIGAVFGKEELPSLGVYLQEYCDEKKIKFEDFLHIAPGVLEDKTGTLI